MQDRKAENDLEETQTIVSDENTELIVKLLSDPKTAALLKALENKLGYMKIKGNASIIFGLPFLYRIKNKVYLQNFCLINA